MKYIYLFISLIVSIISYYILNVTSYYYALSLVIIYLIFLFNVVKKINNYLFLPPTILTLGHIIYIWFSSLLMKLGVAISHLNAFEIFDDYQIQKSVFITLISNIIVWIVFFIFYDHKKKHYFHSYIKYKFKNNKIVNISILIILIILYISLFSGNFGYYATNDEYVNITNSLFNLLMLMICYKYFFSKINMYMIFVFILIVVFAILSASKSLIIVPILYITILNYFKTKSFSFNFILLSIALLLLAFSIIPKIREIYEGSSIVEANLNNNISYSEASNVNAGQDFLNRLNYVPVLCKAIEYNGKIPNSVENLWEYTLLSPIYAVVPRFIYSEKPTTDFSRWFSYNIARSTETNNISATYQGILFMNGGLISVILGFILVGGFMYFFYFYFYSYNNLPFYVSMTFIFATLTAEPWMFFSGTLQNIIIFIIFRLVFLEKVDKIKKS
jgi:hypothetical protein